MAFDPVGLRVGLEAGDGIARPGEAECEPPQSADGPQPLGAALVEPDDRRPKRRPVLVGDDEGDALGSERDTGDRVRADR